MSQPNRKSELEQQDWELHIEAGLVYWGKDDDGENEWVGTNEKWQQYELLKDNLEN